ncbi:MAG: hypothetical protein Q9174_004238 [Haloplaca sp. 1 TL-2023]
MAPGSGSGPGPRVSGFKKVSRESHKAPVHTDSVSVNALKSKIRDVTRVLEHAQDLPMDVRIEKQRALAGYKQDLGKAQREKERQQMIKRYHMVRFFERQKATRNLKKLRTRLASADSGSVEHQILESAVHVAEVDLNYTLYHPLLEKYVGIFPREKSEEANILGNLSMEKVSEIRLRKPSIWAKIEDCMDQGTLQALRDGKLPIDNSATPVSQANMTEVGPRETEKKHRQHQTGVDASTLATANEKGDSSDGGFFDE